VLVRSRSQSEISPGSRDGERPERASLDTDGVRVSNGAKMKSVGKCLECLARFTVDVGMPGIEPDVPRNGVVCG
jgi:hypothetical protein